MFFEEGHLYHIYNQGNNRQRIFFTRENYLFFLSKIKKHVLPYSDILAWCLMPNHFHLMVHVNSLELPLGAGNYSANYPSNSSSSSSPSATLSRARTTTVKTQSFQHSIGVMLASYTRAINKQMNWSGSLFRSETKAICLTQVNKLTQAYYISKGVTSINIQHPELQYPNICFNYINLNPLKDGLVNRNEDWEFSSYPDVVGLRNGKLISRERILEFGLTII
ncbi:MAG: transposase [Bacteroidales bacterium]